MKQLLLNPVILLLVLSVGSIYLLLLFNTVSWSKKLANFFEDAFVFIFLFQMPGLSVAIFPKIHPAALYNRDKTIPSLVAQIALYAAAVFILSPQLQKNLKDIVYAASVTLVKNSFLWSFVLILLLSTSWSETPDYTLRTALVFGLITLVSAYIGKQYSFEKLDKILRWSLALNAILSAYYALAVPSIGINTTKNSWQGINSHANPFAALMALSSALWLFEAFSNPKRRWLSVGLTLFSLYALNSAESAGAKVNFLGLTCILLAARFLNRLNFRWAMFVIVIFLVFGIGLSIVVTENLEAIVVDGLGKDLTLTGRTPLWEYLIKEKIALRPWLGYGFHGFWQPWRGSDNPAANALDGKLWMPSGDGFWTPPHAHNGFMEIILEVGWVGFAIFALSFITTLVGAVRCLVQKDSGYKAIDSILPMILFLYVIFPNLTISRLTEPTEIWCFYVIIAVGTSLDPIRKQLNQKERMDPTYSPLPRRRSFQR
ncbi:O-antigen ligase family protein [Phormidium pseudopriestleyi FRX01]|uniref:O-antigen ligase family protein n=1 Tax=Phormidium pseudopriestleyi FRX01 TaxID=1759528 RepID=A0ABS3FLW3_9CYAN|nr:O-antigen ligase family protein [Phormidium pseudopriestleyi]MBO0348028.1 O-antigen ligase family protein [Phormidium pseudopriestleyi FRX01]